MPNIKSIKYQYITPIAGGTHPSAELTAIMPMMLIRGYFGGLDDARQRLVTTLDTILQKRFDSEIVIFTGRRGQGMSMLLTQTLLREVMRNPGQRVYTNFELPKTASEMIGKYATIDLLLH